MNMKCVCVCVCKYIEFLSQKTELKHIFFLDFSGSLDTTLKSNTVFVDFKIGLLIRGRKQIKKENQTKTTNLIH